MGELRFLRKSAIGTTVECEATAGDRLPRHASAEPRALCAYNQTRGKLLGVEVEVADFSPSSLESRLPALTPQSGIALWIVPFRGISPANIHVPVDLLYLDRNNAVLDVVEFFPIGRVSPSSMPAASVLALPADTIGLVGIMLGDQLILCPPEEMEQRLRDLLKAEAGDREKLSPSPSVVAPPSLKGPKEFEPTKNWLQRLFKRGPRDLRKATREPIAGIVAYFFTGGGPAAHLVRDISPHGIYIFTEERWYLGTVIRVTICDRQEPAAEHSITVSAKVVRWGNDGAGFEVVLGEGKDRQPSQVTFDEPMGNVTRGMLQQFLDRVKVLKN
jgi:hypothetical protein